MGHAIGPEFKAQMELGTIVPYCFYLFLLSFNILSLLVNLPMSPGCGD